jgi:hypothetical protein
MPLRDCQVLLVLVGLLAAGCATEYPKKLSPLHPPQMSADCVALEILSVRLPPRSQELKRRIWNDVDEQQLPGPLRQRLAHNGFQAGVVGQVPAALAEIMATSAKPPARGGVQRLSAADLATAPRVIPRQLQIRASQRGEIVASGIHADLPVLVSEAGELHGQSYRDAQGIFALAAFPQADGQVRVDLVPELHYGRSQPHYVGEQAIWRLESSRPKRVFDDMKISALLMPGSMLIVGCLPDRPGSLGHSFFTADAAAAAGYEEKVLLVRVCQTQHDDLVQPPPLPLEP